MNDKAQSLPDDTKTLQDMVLALQSQVESLQDEKQQLIEQFRLAKQKQFGASSEGHPDQGELFNEAEAEVEQREAEPDQEISLVFFGLFCEDSFGNLKSLV